MTLPSFPVLSMRAWPLKRSPVWSTLKQPSISGQETRQELWSYPRWKYELTFDTLRSDAANREWQQVLGLFNQCRGAARMFTFADPADSTALNQPFGVGNGTVTSFQLVRSLGGFAEPVFAPISTTVQKSDWQGLVNISAGGRTNLLTYSNPAAGGWGVAGTISAASVTTPDGGSSCAKLVDGTSDTAGMAAGKYAGTAGVSYTKTIWAKALSTGSRRYLVSFYDQDWAVGSYAGAVFDLQSGTVNVIGSGITATITAGTNGWYRCVTTAQIKAGATDAYVLYRVTSDPTDIFANNTPSAGSGLYLFGAQYEAGAAGTSYIPTAGAAVTVVDYSVGGAGSIFFPSAPAAGTSLLWSGTFAWLCRFDADEMQFQQDYAAVWSLKSCMFTTEKL